MVLDVFMDVVMEIKEFNPDFKVKVGTIVSSPTIKLETGKGKGRLLVYFSILIDQHQIVQK